MIDWRQFLPFQVPNKKIILNIYNYGEGLGKSGTSNEKTIPNWEFYDLINDPGENQNNFENPVYKQIIEKLYEQLIIEKKKAKDYELEIPKIS